MKKTWKTMKRIVSVLLALAMIVTSISYTPKTVSAAELTSTETSLTYVIEEGNGNIEGFVYRDALEDTGVRFEWGDPEEQTPDATVEIKQGDEIKADLGIQKSGYSIQAADLDSCELAEGDYSIVFTQLETEYVQTVSLTVKTGDTETEPEETGEEEEDYEGMLTNEFYNLALRKPVIPSSDKGPNSQLATNGAFENNDTILQLYAGADGKVWVTVDLGAYYDASVIDKIFVSYKENNAASNVINNKYSISFSPNGEDDWTTVVPEGEDAVAAFDYPELRATVDEIDGEEGKIVRYVRIAYNAVPTYGYHISEIAVFDTDKGIAETVPVTEYPAPEFTAVAGGNNEIIVNITPVDGAKGYAIYVDGVLANKDASADENISIESPIGNHTVTVKTISDYEGNRIYSEASEGQDVVVTGHFDEDALVGDPLYNLAYKEDGSNASYGGGNLGGGNIHRLTDGIIADDGNYVELNHGTEGTYFQVDLEKEYTVDSIDEVAIYYRRYDANFNPRHANFTSYEIQYSVTGEDDSFVTVKTVTKAEIENSGARPDGGYLIVDEMDKSAAKALISSVRYIRVVYHGSIAYGAQAREMAVFNTTGTAKEYDSRIPAMSAEDIADDRNDIGNVVDDDSKWEELTGSNGAWFVYDPEEIRISGSLDDITKILHGAFNDTIDVDTIESVTINGCEVDSTNARQFTVDTLRVTEDGIYRVETVDASGTHYMYYKRVTPPDYSITGATVADITADSATISWTESPELEAIGHTYTIEIDGEVVTEGELNTPNFTWTPEGGLEEGHKYIAVIKAYSTDGKLLASTEEESVTFTYLNVPTYLDLATTNVKITYTKEVGATGTLEITFKNLGRDLNLSDADVGGNILFKFFTSINPSNNGETAWFGGNLGTYIWMNSPGYMLNYITGLDEVDNEKWFRYNSEITYKRDFTVSENFLNQDAIRVGFVNNQGLTGSEDINQANNSFIWYKVPLPKKVTATMADDNKSLIVDWDEPDDAAENEYKYYLYLNDSEEPVEVNGDTTYTFTNPDGSAFDGVQSVVVKTVNAYDDTSSGVTAKTFAYEIDENNWNIWDYGIASAYGENGKYPNNHGAEHNVDVYGNTWYYYDGYGMERKGGNGYSPTFNSALNTNSAYHGLFNNGRQTNKNEVPAVAFLFNTTLRNYVSATINGVTYDKTSGKVGDNGGDVFWIAQELFDLDGARSKVFEIIIEGENNAVFTALIRVVNPIGIPPVTDLAATLSEDDGSVTLTWTNAKVDDNDNKAYTYNVYHDGDLIYPGIPGNEEGNELIFNDHNDGRHSFAIVTRDGDDLGDPVFTYIIIYDKSDLIENSSWVKWNHRTKGIYNNTWWYAIGEEAIDGDELYVDVENPDSDLGSQITSDGRRLQIVFGKEGAFYSNISTVTIKGASYEISSEEMDPNEGSGEKYADVYINSEAPHRVYINLDLFQELMEDSREEIIPVTIRGTMGEEEETYEKTVLFKLMNEDYSSENVDLVNKDGSVILSWDDPNKATNRYGYQISYYRAKDSNYDPNNPDDNKITTVTVGRGITTYDFTEAGRFIRSNTEVVVKPIMNSAGSTGEEIGMAVAQAELEFDGDPYAYPGAYIGQDSTIIFKIKNTGTALAITKAQHDDGVDDDDQPVENLRIKLTEYEDDSYEVIKGEEKIFERNMNDADSYGIEPGATFEATFDYKFNDRTVHYFTAEIDPDNWIYEGDQDENNLTTFTVAATFQGKLYVQLDEDQNEYVASFKVDDRVIKDFDKIESFTFTYFDNGEEKTCTVPRDKVKGTNEQGYTCNLTTDADVSVTNVDVHSIVTITANYSESPDNTDIESVVFADYQIQDTEMDWTPLVKGTVPGPNEPYEPHEFSLSGTKVTIDYKVLSTNITDVDYADIFDQGWYYNQQKWFMMSMSQKKSREGNVYNFLMDTKEVDGKNYNSTLVYFTQTYPEYSEDYQNHKNDEVNYELHVPQNVPVVDFEDKIIPANSNNGMMNYEYTKLQINAENFGIGKYYAMKIVSRDGYEIVVAFRVSDGDGDKWFAINNESDNDPSPLFDKIYYHNGDAATRTPENVVSGATYYYDASDWDLSSVGWDHTNHLFIRTDSEDLGIQNNLWLAEIHEAKLDENGEVVPTDLKEPVECYPGDGMGSTTYFTNAIIRTDISMENLPVHTGESGEQSFYYLIRLYPDKSVRDTEEGRNNPDNYVSIPIKVEVDIPEIQNIKNGKIDDVASDTTSLLVTFTESDEGRRNDYYYDIYVDDQLYRSDLTEGGTYAIELPSDQQDKLITQGTEFNIKVVSKWCYVHGEDPEHYYDGENHYQKIETTYVYTVELPHTDVEVQGFQINTDKTPGSGVSEFMPSMRVVSRAGKVMIGTDDKPHKVLSYGTIIALGDEDSVSKDTMTIEYAETDDAILNVPSTTGALQWTGEGSADYYYYAVSLKKLEYEYEELEKDYYFRAYAELDNGDGTTSIVYGKNVYKVNVYEIAENLYKERKMRTESANEFLYEDVLNIKSMYDNATSIGTAMLKTLRVKDTASDEYKYSNTAYKDLIYYATATVPYYYQSRGKFTSKHLGAAKEAELLQKLNTTINSDAETLYEWIQTYVGTSIKVGDKTLDLTMYPGFYQKVDYKWDNNLHKEYETGTSDSE